MKYLSQEANVHITIDPAQAGAAFGAGEPLVSWRAAQMKARLARLRLIAGNGAGAPLPPPKSARRQYSQADLELAARAFARIKHVPAYDGPRLAIESDANLNDRVIDGTVNRLMKQLDA